MFIVTFTVRTRSLPQKEDSESSPKSGLRGDSDCTPLILGHLAVGFVHSQRPDQPYCIGLIQ